MKTRLPHLYSARAIRLTVLLVCLVSLGWKSTTGAAGPIIYVDADAAPGGDGSSWSEAYDGLQAALAEASAGDQIWVADGVYKPGNLRESSFSLVDGVAIYGGFDGAETALDQRDWENHVTVLSGDIDNNDIVDAHGVVTTTAHIVGNNSYHVVTCVGGFTARLDGLTITGGKADHSSDPAHSKGGGMYSDAKPILDNVIFGGNSAQSGGGMMSWAYPTLKHVTFRGNSAAYDGGGMASAGSPILMNVVFSGNSAEAQGGGMAHYSGHSTLVKVTLLGNTAENGGGHFARQYCRKRRRDLLRRYRLCIGQRQL
jgi:hypothetical protein